VAINANDEMEREADDISGACCEVAGNISKGIDGAGESPIRFKLVAGLDKYRLVLALEEKAAHDDDGDV
jgi:hypothetical protein